MPLRCLLIALVVGAALPAQEIRFNRDIRPLLSENCLSCHGPDKNARQAGLRLDVREEAVEREAIVPGEPEKSRLVARIRIGEPALRMPPPQANKTLTGEQKDLLERWIEQGAEYEPHWAYLPPERPEAPEGPAAIDFLLEKKLRDRGLATVDLADRRTLIRRLSFDLTGLPPSPDEVAAFEADPDPRAYDKLVGRLLASPRYGERMAVHWLDLVRYADTVGFHSDVPVNVYPYRDYVIRSFNENKRFDQFTREQLAGDLLPDPDPEQLVATAYNRLNRMTNEGGAQAKEYLVRYASDRVRTTSTVWLGSTLACAECHDHKFDPFSTEDFYRFSAFFADIEEVGVYRGRASFGPSVRVMSERAREDVHALESRLAALREDDGAQPADSETLAEFSRLITEQARSWQPLEPSSARDDCSNPDVTGCNELDLCLMGDGVVEAAILKDQGPNRADYLVEAPLEGGRRITALALEAMPSNDYFEESHLSRLEARLLRGGRSLPLRFEVAVADQESPEALVRDTLDDNDHTGWVASFEDNRPRRALWALAKPLETQAGDWLLVKLEQQGRSARKLLGRFRLLTTGADFPALPPPEALAEAAAAVEPTTDQQDALRQAYTAMTAANPHWLEIRRLERQRKALLDAADECLITQSAESRPVRILPRGDWMNETGEVVTPQTPHFLPHEADEQRLTRLDLADWLTDPENPLTARVFVNRLWKMFFGTGLSKTLDDLGSQGEPPVNPELLDWLAVEFMESGWNVKHVVRTILLSDAYRRSSEPSAELRAADPYNRLHGRQAMLRLDAEFIRDNALLVSGLLNGETGGPSAKPYQPMGYYAELNFPKREYRPDADEEQYRRGLYTHWQRTFLHPAMMAFDAPSREECTAYRTVSNTPLQSLTLLNDPTFVEAARAFAARILEEAPAATEARLGYAFERAFSRQPTGEEVEVLASLLARERDRFETEPAAARRLLQVGLAPTPSAVEPAELAAWTSVARALFNKHEFLMRY